MEADLQRYYGVDYRQRWCGNLTLRRIHVLLSCLPEECATFAAESGYVSRWSIEAHLLDELRMALTGDKQNPPKPHPARPTGDKPKRVSPERSRNLAAARRRKRERDKKIASGEIT